MLRRPNFMLRSAAGLVCLAILGCPSDPPTPDPEPVSLINGDGWVRITDPSIDAFADQRPADAVCDDAGWSIDPFADSLELDTALCNYPTFAQPILEPLAPGDVVDVVGFHDVLTSEDPDAVGYMAFAIDGQIVWEWSVAIPLGETVDAALIEDSFTLEQSFPAGAEIQLHIHNHGPNSWELISVDVTHAP